MLRKKANVMQPLSELFLPISNAFNTVLSVLYFCRIFLPELCLVKHMASCLFACSLHVGHHAVICWHTTLAGAWSPITFQIE